MADKKPNFFDRVASRLGYKRAEQPTETKPEPTKEKGVALTTSAALGTREYAPAKSADMLGAYTSWVFACVKARGQDVANIELKLFKVLNRKTGEVEEVPEHDVLSLIRSVNPFMTATQLFEYTQGFKDLTGEAFWWLERAGNSGTGIITKIWLLRPDYMTVKTSKDGFVSGYEYKVPGQEPIAFEIQEIIHHKEFNPANPYRGMGIIRAAAVTVDTDNYAEEYNKNFFKNSAVPEIVLSTEQKLNDQQVKRMHAEWANKYGGVSKAHKLAILEGGLDVKPFSISQKDMEFLEGQGFTRDKILAMFQVPKSRLGMTEGVTVSNAEATINIYLKYVVKPLMERLADALTEFMLPLYTGTEDMFFGIEDPVPENVEAETKRLRELFSMGAITPNEARHEQGFDEVEGLDSFYLPINQAAIAGDGAQVPQVARDEEGKAVQNKNSKGRRAKVRIPAQKLKDRVYNRIATEIRKEVMGEVAASFANNQPGFIHKAQEEMPQNNWAQETKEAFWKQLVGKAENYEKKYEAQVIKLFNDQEAATIARLNMVEGRKALMKFSKGEIEDILISVTAENKVAADLLLPIVEEILSESGTDTLEFVGSEQLFDASAEAVKEFMRKDALKGIRVMNKVTKGKLRKALAEALSEGVGPVETARKIRGVFEEARSVRAIRIARTETLKAANHGALAAYKQSGVVAGKQWFTAQDEVVCQWCGPLQGKVKGIDQNFFNLGESYLGKEGGIIKFNFDDIPTPPLHPNCRCTLIPITVNQRNQGHTHTVEKQEEQVPFSQQLKHFSDQVSKDIQESYGKILNQFEQKSDELLRQNLTEEQLEAKLNARDLAMWNRLKALVAKVAQNQQRYTSNTGNGSGGGNLSMVQETPAGLINGSNKVYTLTSAPVDGSLLLFINEALVSPSRYTVNGNQITFVVALDAAYASLPFDAFYQEQT